MSDETGHGSYALLLQPSGAEPLTVIFEPGAGEFELEPGSAFRIEVSGPSSERIEFTHGDGLVSVWPSPALSVRVIDSRGEDVRLLGY